MSENEESTSFGGCEKAPDRLMSNKEFFETVNARILKGLKDYAEGRMRPLREVIKKEEN